MQKDISITAFGKNDIRGIYGQDVTEELFFYTAQAYVQFVAQETKLAPQKILISVAKDARTHSTPLTDAIIRGIVSTGANVLDLGLVPSPLAYFSEFCSLPEDIFANVKINGSLTITASHNPSEYNGLKMTFNKKSLTEKEILKVKKITEEIISSREVSKRFGLTKKYDVVSAYIEKMLEQSFSNCGKGLKVVVDSANGTAGVVAPKLYKELGCEVVELFSEPDGRFPNHHPNPCEESTLGALKQKVVETGADLGLAFDGDSDRLGVVDSEGNKIPGDLLLLIYALDIIKDLCSRGEKPAVVAEVKCSQILFDEINNKGARALMCKTGHGYIKSMMRSENAILGGEMSGHLFFKDRYYGFDDAIYAGCRIIEIVSKYKKQNPDFKIGELIENYLKMTKSAELRFHCPNELKKIVLEKFEKNITSTPNFFGSEIKDIIRLDGMRIVFEDGFELVRQSNTEPVLTLRFEAKDEESCNRYYNKTVDELDKILKEL